MVSNTLGMEHQDLMELLKRLGSEFAKDREYLDLRAALPADWPI